MTQPFANVWFLLGSPQGPPQQGVHGLQGAEQVSSGKRSAANIHRGAASLCGVAPRGPRRQELVTAPSAERAHLLFAALAGVCEGGPKSRPRGVHRMRYPSSCSVDLGEQNACYRGSAKTETRAGHISLTWQVHLGTFSEMLYTVWHRKIAHLYSPGTPTPSTVALNPLFFSEAKPDAPQTGFLPLSCE